MATDPVCGMHVDEITTQWRHTHDGTTYCFCGPGCLSAFQEDPEKYVEDKPTGETDLSHHHHGM